MQDFSSPVTSRQQGPHPKLADTVARHAARRWQKPIADHSRRAFDTISTTVEGWKGRVILDTGCGTGMSTGVLARKYPQCLVLGVDKSEVRLGKALELPANARLVRADLEDFWLLSQEFGWTYERQCFFYPNPWPKPEHRMRRWAFHPVLPSAIACGGVWELRTNWEIYALEFGQAVALLSDQEATVAEWTPEEPETLFERKYLASGHRLWRWESKGPVSGPPTSPGRPQLQG